MMNNKFGTTPSTVKQTKINNQNDNQIYGA